MMYLYTVGNKTLTMFCTFGKTSPLLKKELSYISENIMEGTLTSHLTYGIATNPHGPI